MQIHITLHGAMRVVAGRSVVDLAFDDSSVTLDKALEALIAAHPRVRQYLLDARGELRPALRVLVNVPPVRDRRLLRRCRRWPRPDQKVLYVPGPG